VNGHFNCWNIPISLITKWFWAYIWLQHLHGSAVASC